MRPHVAPLFRYIEPRLRAAEKCGGKDFDVERSSLLKKRDALWSPWFFFHFAAVLVASIASLQIAGLLGGEGLQVEFYVPWLFAASWVGSASFIKLTPALVGGCFAVLLTIGWMAYFENSYGWQSAIAVLIVTAAILSNIWDRLGSQNDFVLGARKLVLAIRNNYSRIWDATLRIIFTDAAVAKLRKGGRSGNSS